MDFVFPDKKLRRARRVEINHSPKYRDGSNGNESPLFAFKRKVVKHGSGLDIDVLKSALQSGEAPKGVGLNTWVTYKQRGPPLDLVGALHELETAHDYSEQFIGYTVVHHAARLAQGSGAQIEDIHYMTDILGLRKAEQLSFDSKLLKYAHRQIGVRSLANDLSVVLADHQENPTKLATLRDNLGSILLLSYLYARHPERVARQVLEYGVEETAAKYAKSGIVQVNTALASPNGVTLYTTHGVANIRLPR